MLNEQRTGPISSLDGAINPARSDRQGAEVMTAGHGKYNEAVIRGKAFIAANQAAVTTTAAGGLGLANTGLCVSNPPGSEHNLSILKVGWAWSVAPAAVSSVHLAGGYVATGGVTAHNTPLVVYNLKLGAPGVSVAFADGAATIVGPVYLHPLIGGFTLGTLFAQPMALTDIGGSIIVPPGGYVCIVTLTTGDGFGAIAWEEIPI